MYEQYYGFAEKPFSLTPDPKFLFKSESHGSAFDLLKYAIRRREGFVVITGDIGTGKTTLCRAVLEQIDRKTFTALVLNPFLSEEDLLKLILLDFGVVSREEMKRGRLASATKQDLIETLYDFLLSLLPIHASAALIIDEAQNLPLPVLEQIRILSNLETDKEKLLQIVLVGQLNLQPLLRSRELRQLDQRVSIRYELKPLTREEVAAYIPHRLTIAGGGHTVSFAPKAVDQIHRYSGGIPRLVNLICDRALLTGYSVRASRIGSDIVAQAARGLDLQIAQPRRFRWWSRRASVVVASFGTAAVIGGTGAAIEHRAFQAAGEPRTVAAAGPAGAAAGSAGRSAEANDANDAKSAASAAPARGRVEPVQPGALAASQAAAGQLPVNRPYTIMVGSFRRNQDVEAVDAQLAELEFEVYHVDVDLGARGAWRRVLVGSYDDPESARADLARLKQTREFANAVVVTSMFAARGAQPVPQSAERSDQ